MTTRGRKPALNNDGAPSASPPRGWKRLRTVAAFLVPGMLVTATMSPLMPNRVSAAPVGADFVVTPADLAFILKQIKIAEAHVANTTSATGPCGALLGNGANQVPGPLMAYGLRTVDGTCNNLQPGREKFAAADQVFPRLTTPNFRPAENSTFSGQPTTYASTNASVYDSQPRMISNLIVDQTATNPAAIAVSGQPRRTQGNEGVVPCPQPPANPPAGCIPTGQTLSIPNVTTDVGLSPPYNSLFTTFGQFFDHGLDFTSKSSKAVFIPLKQGDPLYVENVGQNPPPANFMVLNRTANLPGPDGAPGTNDDIKEGTNRDTPFVDLSQNYASHAGHQVFLRQYVSNAAGKPVATGELFGQADGSMATWKMVKDQAKDRLGLLLSDADIANIPAVLADPYGKFIPGPNGFAQWATDGGGTVEGDPTNPVAPPPNVLRLDTAFLDDIAHDAEPKPGKVRDNDGLVDAVNPQPAGTYDGELLDLHFMAGDGRLNENIALTSIHQMFHSEHNRLVADIKNVLTSDNTTKGQAALPEWKLASGAGGWNGERLFQAARFITEMEYQHSVFEEFARKIQPLIQPFTVYHDNINGAINAEFASAVYRFGHSMLTDTVPRINEDGSRNDVSLFTGFLNPPKYYDGGSAGVLNGRQAAGSLIMGMSDEVGQELDEFIVDTVRNALVGLPLDLAALNITRGRDVGLPRLNEFRRQINAINNDASMQPYANWIDFGDHLKNPESLVNFVAAYGKHETIVDATTKEAKRAAAEAIVNPGTSTDPDVVAAALEAFDFMSASGTWATKPTGLEDVDLWIGGLAERTNLFGGLLGSTFNYVFERQMTDLQNGDRFYYLHRTPGMNLRTQLEANSMAEMFMRNTTAKGLKADAFGTADCKFDLGTLNFGPGTVVLDNGDTDCNENALLSRVPLGGGKFEIRYRTSNSVDPAGINGQSVFNGTDGADIVRGGIDNDTFLGNGGNDRLEGNDGADVALGGEGNDIITDLAGDDVPKGGPGNDAIDAGPGLDIVMAGAGDDFTNGGLNDNETFGGDGNDKIIAGAGNDVVFGDSGSDWIEGGDGQDLLCGDSCAPFFDDPNDPGNDILIGQNGEEDYDAEGGDDIMVAGPGIERNAGAAGWDWTIQQNDPIGGDVDLNRALGGLGLPVGVLRDRFQEVEAISGWNKNDVLRGDSIVPELVAGAGFTGADWITSQTLSLVDGLGALLPAGAVTAINAGTPWGKGNIIIGGGGSDLLEGRGADDVIDGDKYVHVYLRVNDNSGNEIGRTELMELPYIAGNPKTLQQAVFAGEVDPANIVAVREILTSPTGPTNIDTAVFSGAKDDYTYVLPAAVTTPFTITDGGAQAGAPARPNDGIDTISNVECLQFSDVRIAVTAAFATACNGAPTGTITINDTTPTENQLLTATSTIADPNGIVGPITYTWEAFSPGGGGWSGKGNGLTFTPSNDVVNEPLRVVATYTDGIGILESVTSAQTAPVINVNDPATGAPALSTLAPQAGVTITGSLGTVADLDGLPSLATDITYEWLANGTPTGINTLSFDPVAYVGQSLSMRVSFVDQHGTAEARVSAATANVLPAPTVPSAPAKPTAISLGLGAITVSWVASANGNSPIVNYDVLVLETGAVHTVTGTSHTVTGLANGTYTFQVRARNVVGEGLYSVPSDPLSPQDLPSAPTIGTATGGLLQASVTWTGPSSNGGSAITGYNVRVLDSTGTAIGSDHLAGSGATSLTVSPLPAGSVTFEVRANNVHGSGPASAQSNSVVVTAPTVPSVPVLGAVTPGVTTANVSWATPANGGSPLTGFDVQVLNAGGTEIAVVAVPGAAATSTTVTGLTASTTYQFAVRAKNAVGNSAYSAPSAPVTTLTAIVPPGAPTIGATARANAAATVNWTAPTSNGGAPITGYSVEVRNATTSAVVGALRPAGATATSLLVTGLVNGTAYTFKVAAVNSAGTGAFSAASASTTPATVPTAPVIGAATRGANGGAVTLGIAWAAPANTGGSAITGYRLYAQELNAANAPIAGAVTVSPVQPSTARNYTFTFPANKNGVRFTIRAEAINDVGPGPLSAASAREQAR